MHKKWKQSLRCVATYYNIASIISFTYSMLTSSSSLAFMSAPLTTRDFTLSMSPAITDVCKRVLWWQEKQITQKITTKVQSDWLNSGQLSIDLLYQACLMCFFDCLHTCTHTFTFLQRNHAICDSCHIAGRCQNIPMSLASITRDVK